MISDRKTEIRFEVSASEVAVLDGYCQATGKDRTHVFRELLEKWSSDQHRIAIVILRVAGRNPAMSGGDRDGQ